MIAVLDYGIGNLASAEKALIHVGGDARLVADEADVQSASGVVLPGVGAFGACARALQASGLDHAARRAIDAGVPFLGICIGFQLLFARSSESPDDRGLGVIEGHVERIATNEKLPQMQWNTVQTRPGRTSAMFPATQDDRWFYFVHSYAPSLSSVDPEVAVATCDYGSEVLVGIEHDNVWGVQFHPEKSAVDGLALLSRFVQACET